MLHHMSFGVRDPGHVAAVLAELMGATAVKAPTPPFPFGAWMVCLGDDRGALLELLPLTTVFDPEAPLGVRQTDVPAGRSASHVLVSSPLTQEAIQFVASREGWRAQQVDTGMFRIIKMWVEDVFLVEFLAKGEAGRYVDAFGTAGLPTLDRKFRDLEVSMAQALSKLPAAVLSEALGQPTA
jgi:hypothetical protein